MNFCEGRVGIMIVRDPSSRCDRPMCQICFGFVKEIRNVFLFGVSKKQGEGPPPPHAFRIAPVFQRRTWLYSSLLFNKKKRALLKFKSIEWKQ